MRPVAALVVAAFALLSARAAVTNAVDVSALAGVADKTNETAFGGWVLFGLDKYDAACIKFDTIGDWLLSPDFGMPIVRIDAAIRCSSTAPTRSLHVLDGVTGRDLGCFPACSTVNSLEARSFALGGDTSVSCVKLRLDGSNNTGVWGIGSLKVITGVPAVAPSALAVAYTKATACGLEWENGEGTVSNRVDTYLVKRGEGAEAVLLSTGFDNFVGNDGQTDYSSKLSEIALFVADGIAPDIAGEKVFAAAGTNGICKIGTRETKGFLTYAGLSDYSGVELRMRLMRYQYVEDACTMNIAYEREGKVETLEVALPDEFEDIAVDLSSVPAGAALTIGYYDGVGGKRRVLIDSLSLVRTAASRLTPVDSRFIPAGSGTGRFSTKGAFALSPKEEYRFEIRAQNADGLVSGAAIVETRLDGVSGFMVMLR